MFPNTCKSPTKAWFLGGAFNIRGEGTINPWFFFVSVNLARSEQFWPRITWDCKQRMGSLSDNKTCHLRPTKSGRINNPFRGPRGDISPTIIGNWVLQGQPLLTEKLQLLRVWQTKILHKSFGQNSQNQYKLQGEASDVCRFTTTMKYIYTGILP